MIIIIHTNRKSLISHLDSYFKTFNFPSVRIVKINSAHEIEEYRNDIVNGKIKYFVFSNGTDKIDQDIKNRILNLNPSQKLIFSENAWLTWQDFLYLDFNGIGNNSDVYDMTHETISNVEIPSRLRSFIHNRVINRLSIGEKCNLSKYVLVPLQVNNDSKLIIGSPHFSRVEHFVDYMIEMIPSNVKILFKNHPDNRNRINIPKLPNVIDITDCGYSKLSLIKESLFVAGINSTFLMESIYMNRKTVAFGQDLFSNKGIVIEGYGKSFKDIVDSKIDTNLNDRFIRMLISKQIPKTHIINEYKKIIDDEKFITPCCSIEERRG
jgi:hypothetical protein